MILSILTGLLCAALIVIGLIILTAIIGFIQGVRRGLEARRREQDDDAS